MEAVHCAGAEKEYVATTPERPLINYTRVPVAALLELERFMKNLAPRLTGVTVPTLIVQGLNDPVVNDAGTEQQFNSIGAKHKSYVTCDLSRHGILAGDGSAEIHETIADFIGRLDKY
jgi:esterase/lipase